jgi:WD40 repeat protein
MDSGNDMKLLRLIDSHPMNSGQIAFHPKETHLLAAGGPGVGGIQIWDVDSGKLYKKLDVVSDTFHALSFNPAGTLLISGDEEGKMTLWNTQSWTAHYILNAHQGRIFDVKINSQGDVIASGSFADKALKLWDAGKEKVIKVLDYGAFAFHPFAPVVAIARQKEFSLYDHRAGEFVAVVQPEHSLTVGLTYNPDGRYVASELESEKICLYDTGNSSQHVLEGSFNFRHPVFSPDGKWVAATYNDYPLIAVWDLESGEQIDRGECDQPLDTPGSLAFNSDGSLIACSYGWRFGGAIAIWQM